MANTIQLYLQENKTILAKVNGKPYAFEGGYRIIAGEENATKFKIEQMPEQYALARFTVEMVNSQNRGIIETDIENYEFMMPVGMAVAGYASILIRCYIPLENGDEEKVIWTPLRVKVWNTMPNWVAGVPPLPSNIEILHLRKDSMQDDINRAYNKVVAGEATVMFIEEDTNKAVQLEYYKEYATDYMTKQLVFSYLDVKTLIQTSYIFTYGAYERWEYKKESADLSETGANGLKTVEDEYGDNYLYLTKDGVIISKGILLPSGGGGGGDSTTDLRLTSLSDLQFTAAVGGSTLINYYFSSRSGSRGTVRLYVNGALKKTETVDEGENSIEVGAFISAGSTTIRLNVTTTVGASADLEYLIEGVELKLTSNFNELEAHTGDIPFRYTVSGEVDKTVYFEIDGVEQEPVTVTSSRQQTYTIPALSHGVHTLKVYATAEINETPLESNELNYNIIAYVSGNNTTLISSKFNKLSATQGDIISIDYIVYNPNSITAPVNLKINEQTVQTLTVGRTRQYWNLNDLTVGNNELVIESGTATKTFNIAVAESDFKLEAVTENLELYLDAFGRSNSEENKESWSYGDYSVEFIDFNWSTNGWINNALRLNGNAKINIPFNIFGKDFRENGKAIEFEFATQDVSTIDTTAIISFSNNRGIRIKMNEALMQSEQSSVTTKYKDEERVRLSFVVEDRYDLRLIKVFINGVLSGLTQYPADDNFAQSTPVSISVNPDGGSVDIYTVRVYDVALSDTDMLNNYVADLDLLSDRKQTAAENDILSGGETSYAKVRTKIATVLLTGELPKSKGDKKAGTIYFEDPLNASRNFEQNITLDVQGTSSQYYPRKNWKIKLASAIDFFGDGFTEDTYTIKINYMESSNSHNTGIAKFIQNENGTIYSELTPPQQTNSKVRTVIDGEPIALFHRANANATPKFYGLGDFNNDKGNAKVLGLTASYPNAECWEFKDNDELLCLFRTNDFSRNPNAFEARYPEDNTNFTQIDNVVGWVYSTQGNLTKFKNEFEQHFNLHYTLVYYILTEMFGMVDSRAKNLFLATWDGQLWYPIFYDMDTSFGLNNEGVNAFSYNIEYNDVIGSQNVWNGSSSVLWNNFKEAYKDEIQELYYSLRSNNKLSYDSVLEALDNITAPFSKALYNADADAKYIEVLEQDNNSTYLYVAQGDRKEHLKWWLDKRFSYLDSKYQASEYDSDTITMRLYSPSGSASTNVVPFNGAFTLRSFIAQYLSVKYGANAELIKVRATAETDTVLQAQSGADLNDKETSLYGASYIKDLGDISNKYVGTLDVSKANKLSRLVVGNGATNYSNTNLISLSIGNNKLLTYLDVRNCPNLVQDIDVSGCENIKEIYATGTSTTAVKLASGGNLETMALPATITNLTIKNQPLLTNLTMQGVTNVSTLVIENVNDSVDDLVKNIVTNSTNLSRVRLIDINWQLQDKVLFDKLMACGGIDENDKNTDKSIVTGRVHINSIGQGELDEIKAYYPNLTITYTTIIEQYLVTFVNYDGTVLDRQYVNKGGNAVDPITRANNPIPTPIRAGDAQYTYTYKGWDTALTGIYSERTITATYTQTVNTYTVNFYNNSSGTPILLYTQYNVPYGSAATYAGDTPTYNGSGTGSYLFGGWYPDITFITGDTDAYAVFDELKVPDTVKPFADCSWAEVKAVLMNGSKNDLNQWVVGSDVWFEVGDEKPITLSTGEQLTIQIADFNHDIDNNGNTVPATFVTKEVMATTHRMNPSNNAGGWANCEMRTYLQTDVFNMLPADLQSVITPVVKKSTEGSQSTNILSSVDNLFLLSQAEVNYSATTAPYNEEGTPYPIFTTSSSSRIKYKTDAGTAYSWWLRSPYPTFSDSFHRVNYYGGVGSDGAIIANGVVPCFAI